MMTPHFQILTDDQKETLFLKTLDVLERTGVRVDNDEGLELLSSAGASVEEKRRVHIPSFLVEDSLASAPKHIDIYNRLGERALVLTDRQVSYASQVDSTYFFDPFDRSRRVCVRADAGLGATLCDALPNIDLVSISSLYSDVPGEIAIRIGHKETLTTCTKPLMHGTGDYPSLKAIAEMAALVAGGWEELAAKPYYIHYAEPLSPLKHTEVGVAKLLFCVEHGIPVVYTPMTAGGSNAPVTAAGNLVACLSETLSGLVISQLKKPGAPIIIGGVPTILDMSTTLVSYGAPEMSLWSAALAEMAQYLKMPVFSTAGCTDAVEFDQQAAAESALSCLMASLSGANLVHDIGFTEAANSASLELIVATNEFIDMIRLIMAGIEISPETLALDVIDQVGTDGSYIGEDHTYNHFREVWYPSLFNRGNYSQWEAAGGMLMGEKTNQRVKQILAEHKPSPLHPDVIAELDVMEKSWWGELP
jgi:trimethylamine--corrinoid protein Co-methyltransferase